MDQWLVRTSKNWIAGPYLKSQIIEMIQAGQLTRDDEICPGNGYWIFLHERAEMLQNLGMECPRKTGPREADEITELENDLKPPNTDDEITDSGIEVVSENTTQARNQIQSFENSEEIHDTTGMIPMLSKLPTSPPPASTKPKVNPVPRSEAKPESLLATLPTSPPPPEPIASSPMTPGLDEAVAGISEAKQFPGQRSGQAEKSNDRPSLGPPPIEDEEKSIPLPTPSPYTLPPAQRTGKIEKPSVWLGVAGALVFVFLLGAVVMFRLLKY